MAYDSAVVSFTTKTDKVDLVQAAHMNAVQSELVTIETILGTGVKGTCTDLKTRLAICLNEAGALQQSANLPCSAIEGQLYYRTSDDKVFCYDGSAWDSIAEPYSYSVGDYVHTYRAGFKKITATSYTKCQELVSPISGTLRIKYLHHSNDLQTQTSRIYVNGVAVGSEHTQGGDGGKSNNEVVVYYDDLTINAGDLISVYAKTSDGSYPAGAGNLSICVSGDDSTAVPFRIWKLQVAGTFLTVANNTDFGNNGDMLINLDGNSTTTTTYIKVNGSWTMLTVA